MRMGRVTYKMEKILVRKKYLKYSQTNNTITRLKSTPSNATNKFYSKSFKQSSLKTNF
jgi:hypothetical protein